MKTKGITIWEQRAEFFVLGVIAIILVVYLMGQFSSPNVKEVDRQPVAPGEWHGKLSETADGIRRKQTAKAIPDQVSEAIKRAQETGSVDLPAFRGKLLARVGPDSPSTIPGYRVVPTVVSGGDMVAANARFVNPELPPPTKPITYQTFALLSDGVVDDHSELESLVGDQPHDITWLTVASQFNIAEALQRLKTAGPDGALALPDRWHGNRVDLLDVRLEREELVDGQWTNSQVVATLPGQLSFRDRLVKHDELDAADRDEILGAVIDQYASREIYQPEFLPTWNGQWLHPSEVEEEQAFERTIENSSSSEDRDRQRNTRSLEKKMKQLANLEQQLINAQGGGGLAGSGGGGGGGGTGTRGGAGGGMGSKNEKIDQLAMQIERLKGQIEDLRKKLGLDEIDEPAEEQSSDGTPVFEEPSDEIWVWGYDVGVVPGVTYRYRVTLVVYNPLFARKLSLVEEQKHLAESLVKVIDASEWSDPLMADPPLQVLAVRAVPSGMGANSGRLGYGEALAEVLRFEAGKWWVRKFTVQPGDVIGRPGIPDGEAESNMDPVDFSTGWYVVDVVPRADATRSETRLGKGARIVLQSLDGERTLVIDPSIDMGKARPSDDLF